MATAALPLEPRVHVMGDIETLGKGNSPVLLSIGAVKFTADTIVERFHIGIEPESCTRYGLTMDAATVMWWMDEKRAEARKEIMEMGRIDLFSALDGFAAWCNQTPVDMRGSFWGNGATFDNVKLKSAYDACGIEYPFHYRADACYRTLKNISPMVEFTQVGTLHNGVADAESQAIHLQDIAKHWGFQL